MTNSTSDFMEGEMAGNSTSIPEQAILYYVKSIYHDAKGRYKVSDESGKRYEADVFIPSIKAAIEYNGEYWHASRESKDNDKNHVFSGLGIFTIVILEGNLKDRIIQNGTIIRHSAHNSPGLHMNEVIEQTIHVLAKQTMDPTQKLLATSFTLSYDQYCHDYATFAKSVFTKYCEVNITCCCAFKFWDKEKNGDIDPKMIPINTTAKFWYSCPSGHSFRISPRDYPEATNKCGKNCEVCVYDICPFISACPLNTKWVEGHLPLPTGICQYVQDYTWDYILGKGNWPKRLSSQLEILISHSPTSLDLQLLKKYYDNATSMEEKERILNVFGYHKDVANSERTAHAVITKRDFVFQIPNARTIDDLLLCKRIIEDFEWIVIIRFANYQDRADKQEAACDFFQWTIEKWENDPFRIKRYLQLVSLPFCSGDLEENFERKLKNVLQNRKTSIQLPVFSSSLMYERSTVNNMNKR